MKVITHKDQLRGELSLKQNDRVKVSLLNYLNEELSQYIARRESVG